MKFVQYCLIGLFPVFLMYSCSKSDPDPTPENPAVSYKLRLTGTVKSCNSSNVTNGDVIITSYQGVMSIHITNGSFDTTLQSTDRIDSVFVWAVDLNSLTTSDTLAIKVSGESINLGQISACAREVDEYVKCTIDNETFVFVPALYDTLGVSSWDTLSAPTTYIYRSDFRLTNSKFYRMQFNGMSAGTFGVNWNSSFHMGRYYSFNMPVTGNATYTSYGNVGEYIRGTINVPFVDNTDSLNHLLTGSFKVRRDH